MSTPLSRRTVVIDGGAGDSAFSGSLVRLSNAGVTILDAGPDYGSFKEFQWPTTLQDSRRMPSQLMIGAQE